MLNQVQSNVNVIVNIIPRKPYSLTVDNILLKSGSFHLFYFGDKL